MAIYFLNLKTFGRANGSSATSAAAYRAGERIRDERTGKTYDHSERQDVMHKEIVLPSKFADDDIAWARDRSSLWNAAEAVETRKNARIAREYLVALPAELSHQGRVGLVRGFSQELSDRYGFAVDFAIHAPRDFPGSDPRNFHAHLLTTTRVVAIEGLGAKTTLDISDGSRRKLGLGPAINELLHVRAVGSRHQRGHATGKHCRSRRSSKPRSSGHRSRAAAANSSCGVRDGKAWISKRGG
jgi:ATP-dependent exoDNAse (exonuclease V) alpha subunit